jgi:LPXTG-site transpeptidase (sortase) family protein
MLAGHTYSRGAGVFDNLGRLHRGNLARVARDGHRYTFKVTKVVRHAHPSSRTVRSWYNTIGHSRLVMVTCGDYQGDGHYASKIVVYAKRVG